ncbi:Phosphoribosylformylglycinamidine synthase 2 [Enhygromyxa salina]|uniref:Phosphoribosylformylglycinamidine synthase subunit PurL n=1 Tax=Enhygromyxa salina TaxID=215803 RepID=A0A2S9YAP8_9BACT|nr:AIR synthase-related protein [Enhygromyxa salina]PRQ02132.1 Phosphoribosylformylglycinamidine synthase 2 [Enhygromyxa salina]
MTVHRLEIEAQPGLGDPLAEATRRRLETWLDLRPQALRTRKVYHLDLGLDDAEAERVLAALVDPVAEIGALGMLDDPERDGERPWALSVGFLPGVTDAVGRSVARAAADCVGRALVGRAYSSTLYLFWGLEPEAIERAARDLLHNSLIERMKLEPSPRALDRSVPEAGSSAPVEVRTVALRGQGDAELEAISREGMLALSLAEMRAIQAHFEALGRDPTDAEVECLAQTWSEHCKHKIFASPIRYVDPEGVERVVERGLFRGYVRAATEAVAAQRREAGSDPVDAEFLVSVFHDNAGVVRFTEADHLVYKVETHNSPSALDPYGGAMTGIVGVNRDSFGTGLGADLLTNVWGYCFGDPRWDGELPPGLMHPRRIRDGVHHGVIDGGNQSGIPYSRGFELFDARYAGKPLVYCGTVAAMPVSVPGPGGEGPPRPTHVKPMKVGDKVVMVGGRIGKDGIHGATFSSVELDESSPVQAVQIGDPITQRMMWDFLTEARDRGLYSGMTDNGAGGLSSSVGEMAEATGGARIDLAVAPLKYPGLAPWEILISEAQERMTLAVPPAQLDAFLALAERREVEATVLGEFTDDGRFVVRYGETAVCELGLEFLHEGVPLPTLEARWDPPQPPDIPAGGAEAARERLAALDLNATILALLGRPNLAANDDRARAYDHEVKGLSVVKPLIGLRGDVPATATVMRVRHARDEGVVLAEGIHPWYSDLDTDAMARACVDEGVRRVLCAGARVDRIAALDNFCWPDPIESAKTPDGRHKLAQLVRCCEGLYAACVAYGVPLISGKDSMKNDAFLGGVKISIPPTLLVSVIGQMTAVGRSLTLEPRAVGDRVYLLGDTALELGGSELERMLAGAEPLAQTDVPRTDLDRCWARYRAFVEQRDAGRVRSAHVCGRGGLALALSHMVLAAELGLELELDGLAGPGGLSAAAALLSESTGRIVLTCTEADAPALEQELGAHGLVALGRVTDSGALTASLGARSQVSLTHAQLRARYEEGLHGL